MNRLARTSFAFLAAFGLAEVGVGLARAATTTYVPVLLDDISHSPALIGAVMLVNAAAGFAVPLAVGLWSDRRSGGGLGRRTPFVLGGVAVTSAGLLAVAAGAETSYPVLGLAAGCVYLGLNATATAHRAVVIERFEDSRRPAATSSQELAMLIGGLLGLAVGGALIEGHAALVFVVAAVVAPLLAVPTAILLVRMERRPLADRAPEEKRATLRSALRHPGAREVLLAQILWVAGYIALPVFFVLYADRVLDLGAGAAAGNARGLRHSHRRGHDRRGACPAGAGVPAARAWCRAARRWPAWPQRRRLSRCRSGSVRLRSGRCGPRDGPRLPVLRPLRAAGRGWQL